LCAEGEERGLFKNISFIDITQQMSCIKNYKKFSKKFHKTVEIYFGNRYISYYGLVERRK